MIQNVSLVKAQLYQQKSSRSIGLVETSPAHSRYLASQQAKRLSQNQCLECLRSGSKHSVLETLLPSFGNSDLSALVYGWEGIWGRSLLCTGKQDWIFLTLHSFSFAEGISSIMVHMLLQFRGGKWVVALVYDFECQKDNEGHLKGTAPLSQLCGWYVFFLSLKHKIQN